MPIATASVAIDSSPSPMPAQATQGPLSAQDYRALDQANRLARQVLAAGRVAMFNGVTSGLFAGVSLMFAWLSFTTLVVGLALAAVTWNEFRGRQLLSRFDPRGPAVLGYNQLILLGLVILYCIWQLFSALTGPDPLAAYDEVRIYAPHMSALIDVFKELHWLMTFLLYGMVVILSAVFQGFTAWYYFARRKPLEAYQSQTPPWIQQLHRICHPV